MENSFLMKLNNMIGMNNSSLVKKDFDFNTVNPQQGPPSPTQMQGSNIYQGNLQGEWIETPNQTVLHKEMLLEPKCEQRLI